jgi:thiol:disulfide interchange protein DsbD
MKATPATQFRQLNVLTKTATPAKPPYFCAPSANSFPMLRSLFTFLLLALTLGLTAQFTNPISWDFSYQQVEGNEFDLIATSTAENGFSIYSQYTPEGGPIPTSFTWEPGAHYELVGKSVEKGHKKSGIDDLFGIDVIKFLSDQPVTFTQRVKVKDFSKPIDVMVEWMCCDDEQCLPPTDEVFSYVLPAAGAPRGEVAPGPAKPADAPSATKPEPQTSTAATSPASSTPTSAPAAAPEKEDNLLAEGKAPNAQQAEDTAYGDPIATYRAEGLSSNENKPVSWVLTAEQLTETDYKINITGHMDEGWTVYSKDADPDIGLRPTTFFIETGNGVTTVGETSEESATLTKKYDKAWDATVDKIDGGNVTYSQLVRVSGKPEIKGYVEYMTCNDETCFPPVEVPFALNLAANPVTASIDGLVGGGQGISLTAPPAGPTVSTNELGISANFVPEPVGDCSEGARSTAGKSLWAIFGLGLLGGLFAMLMPCIFPMIPLTVSFFTKSGGTRAEGIRKAGLYGFFIFMIYVLLSAPFHLLDGLDPSILNTIASNVYLNIVFFLVFMFFAGSFFGFYELTLPESWSNRASQAEGSGGIIGIFFMALTLALVSFSCTGPILGSLLVETLSGGAWPLTAGMAGFGVALGLPFALFAAFPGFLQSMPKSGGWLNSVKVVLGFVEVALAFKFLSTADLVGEWDLLRIEPFLFIWILCAIGIAAYLFGLISFPLDSKKRKRSPIGVSIAIAAVVFTGYLVLGLTADGDTGTYKGRNLLSGIAPPVCYNYFLPCDENLNITPFKSLEEGLAFARKVNKPVMLDFTGYSCVNCRKMEEHVWTVGNVKRYLTDEYVIVSLYVDDRTELPKAQQREVDRMDGTGRTRLIDNVGKKWQYLQQNVYAKSSQPYYVLISPDGTTLNPPVAYTPDADVYEDFLECGLSTYRALSTSK